MQINKSEEKWNKMLAHNNTVAINAFRIIYGEYFCVTIASNKWYVCVQINLIENCWTCDTHNDWFFWHRNVKLFF